MRYKTYNYYQNKKSDVKGDVNTKKQTKESVENMNIYKHKTKEFTEGGQCH